MEFTSQAALQFGCALAKADSAQAALGGSNQHSSQRSRHNRERDRRARTAAPVRAGRHAKLLVGLLVETAGRAEACVVQCGGHVFSFAQFGLDMLHAPRRLILARTEPGGALEQPLQMKRAEPDTLAELRQRHHAFGIVEQLPRPKHVLRLGGDFRRLATQTGAITGALGFTRIGEELNRVAPRTTAGTRWTAVNAGGTYRENEASVLPGVARHHLLPMVFVLVFILKFGLHGHSVAPACRRRYPALAGKAFGRRSTCLTAHVASSARGPCLRASPSFSHAPRRRAGSL